MFALGSPPTRARPPCSWCDGRGWAHEAFDAVGAAAWRLRQMWLRRIALPLIRTGPSSPERPARQSSPVAMRCPARWVPRLVPCRMDSLPATGYRGETLAIAGHWARAAQTSQRTGEVGLAAAVPRAQAQP